MEIRLENKLHHQICKQKQYALCICDSSNPDVCVQEACVANILLHETFLSLQYQFPKTKIWGRKYF